MLPPEVHSLLQRYPRVITTTTRWMPTPWQCLVNTPPPCQKRRSWYSAHASKECPMTTTTKCWTVVPGMMEVPAVLEVAALAVLQTGTMRLVISHPSLG